MPAENSVTPLVPHESDLTSAMSAKQLTTHLPFFSTLYMNSFVITVLFVVIMAFGGKEINGYSFIDNLIDHTMLLVKPS